MKERDTMQVDQVKAQAKKDFNNAICLMAIIPFLTFLYILGGIYASFPSAGGKAVPIISICAILILLGIISGKKIIWNLISNLIDFSEQLVSMQKELGEKNRIVAVSETVLSLSHEINNPLFVMQGNLALLENDLAGLNMPNAFKDRLNQVKSHCERISSAVNKISGLNMPVASSVVHGDTKMLNLE